MAEENTPRVYGMADQDNRDPPPAQGMRGEQSAPGPRANDPEFCHMVTLENGKRVPVAEGNGVAFAEASGRIARPEDRELQVEFVPEETGQSAAVARRSRAPLLIGALTVGAAAGVYLIERLRRSVDTHITVRPTLQPSVPVEHETGPLVPVQQLPHQQPFVDEISPSAS